MRTRLLIGAAIAGAAIAAGVVYSINRPAQDRPADTDVPRDLPDRSHDIPSGAVAGHVLTPGGEPASGASVYATNGRGSIGRLIIARTDEEGAYLIEGLRPDDYYMHTSKEDDGHPPSDEEIHSGSLTDAPKVTVHEGQTTRAPVLRLMPKAARLVGHVVDAATNKPMKGQGVVITLRRLDDPEHSYLQTGPDEEGEFSLLVPPDPISVEFSAPGYRQKRLGFLRLRKEELRRLNISLSR